jgi:uncharacterized membrane protein
LSEQALMVATAVIVARSRRAAHDELRMCA